MSDPIAYFLNERGQIRPELAEDLLVEVITGKLVFESNGELYACRPPTLAEQDQARVIYTRRVHECKKKGIPTRADIEAIALRNDFFDALERQECASLEQLLTKQHKSRENTRDPKQKVELAAEIEKVQQRIIELKLREEELYVHSAENKAEEARTAFLVSKCTMGGELLDHLVWADWQTYKSSTDWSLLIDSRKAYMRVMHGLPIKIIRAIARTYEWKTRWKAAKESGSPLFEGSSADWDTNKRNLAWWTDFYDAIARHPEAPSDEIVQDDDALQDWVNRQIARKNQAGTPASNKPPPTYIDGHGRRQSMVRVGESRTQVNTPYRIRA